MQDDGEQKALSRIREFLKAGRTLDEIRDAGWGEWLSYFEANQIEVEREPESSQSEGARNTTDEPEHRVERAQGNEISETTEEAEEEDFDDDGDAFDLVEERYGALATVSTVLRILGWIILVGGILASVFFAFGAFNTSAETGGDSFANFAAVSAIFGVILSAVWGVILLALADLIRLLIDIERNTRAAALISFNRSLDHDERT